LAKIVSGAIPKDINGVYLRNGPNPRFLPNTNRNHLFDGDAMVHATRIKDGRMYYCNKFLDTPKLRAETKAGMALDCRAGEVFGLSGLLKFIIAAIKGATGYFADWPPLYYGFAANTAFAHHSKRTYALYESDYPFHIVVDRKEDAFDIKSIGHDTFNG